VATASTSAASMVGDQEGPKKEQEGGKREAALAAAEGSNGNNAGGIAAFEVAESPRKRSSFFACVKLSPFKNPFTRGKRGKSAAKSDAVSSPASPLVESPLVELEDANAVEGVRA
jgi:hypothetical protein